MQMPFYESNCEMLPPGGSPSSPSLLDHWAALGCGPEEGLHACSRQPVVGAGAPLPGDCWCVFSPFSDLSVVLLTKPIRGPQAPKAAPLGVSSSQGLLTLLSGTFSERPNPSLQTLSTTYTIFPLSVYGVLPSFPFL